MTLRSVRTHIRARGCLSMSERKTQGCALLKERRYVVDVTSLLVF